MRDAWALAAALRSYAAQYSDEAATVGRFIELAARGLPAYHREHAPGHFTASALVFDRSLIQVLLTHHRKLDIWIQLGGHADGEVDLLRAAQREAAEESGLADIVPAHSRIVDIDIHPIPPHGGEPGHDHYDIRYAFFADPDAPLLVSDESHDLSWVHVARLGEFSRETSLHRAVRKALETVSVVPQRP